MTFSEARDPELDAIVVRFPKTGYTLRSFTEYSFNSHFLTPTDGFSFTVGDEDIDQDLIEATELGSEVVLSINDRIQATGYILESELGRDRQGGTILNFQGADKLHPVVTSHVDPKHKFAEGQSLADVLRVVFGDFGFTKFEIDNEANRNVITGQLRGVKASKRGRPLKDWKTTQLQPAPQEGAFAYVARIAARFGLLPWLSADGQTVIVSEPDFDQPPRYRLQRKHGVEGSAENNIRSGRPKRDISDQPSIIYGFSQGGGGEFDKASCRAARYNPFITAPGLPTFVARYKEIVPAGAFDLERGISVPFAKPLFLQDDESKTPEQLEYFLQRKMSEFTRKTLVCPYQVAGHTCNGQPWAVDTVADVDDDDGRVREPMWIMSRTFTKSRSGGTATDLELIRLGTLVL
jgi:prophage tail gpP-like protein